MGNDFMEAMHGYVSNVPFIPTDDQERKERIAQEMSSAPQHVLVSVFEGVRDYDPTEAGQELGKGTRERAVIGEQRAHGVEALAFQASK